jgi:hypothetical protein
MEKITKQSLSLGLITLACGFSALAGPTQATARKPASSIQCGSQEMAVHVAVREAVYENHETSCSTQSVTVDGPMGSFVTYHVSLSCTSSTSYNYDVETHLQGIPGKMACTTSIHTTGSFEAQ